MATKYIAYGGCPPGVSQTSHSLHTAVLQGIAVFFSSTLFFLFLHPFSQNSTYCCLHALVFWRAHFLFVGKWQWLPLDIQRHPSCRGPPSVWIFPKIQTKRRFNSVDAGKKKIWIRGQFIEVTDEVYTAYMKGDR